jgi:hypothetical protein
MTRIKTPPAPQAGTCRYCGRPRQLVYSVTCGRPECREAAHRDIETRRRTLRQNPVYYIPPGSRYFPREDD